MISNICADRAFVALAPIALPAGQKSAFGTVGAQVRLRTAPLGTLVGTART